MDCSSPISAYISLKKESSDLSSAGICRPESPISSKRPIVFKDTVFPPVFGPVTISRLKLSPSSKSTGTTFFGSMRGCRAPFKRMISLLLKIGRMASMESASSAFAKIKSSSDRMLSSANIESERSAQELLKTVSMRCTSSLSLSSHSLMSLFSFTTDCGSIKSVEPDADWSCIMPGTRPLYSERTGRQ